MVKNRKYNSLRKEGTNYHLLELSVNFSFICRTRSKEKIVTRRRIAESDAPKQTIDPDSNYILEERIAEEEEERRLMEENTISEEVNKEEGTDKHGEGDDEEDSDMPVPQVRIGPNGEIILDEQSLVSIFIFNVLIHFLNDSEQKLRQFLLASVSMCLYLLILCRS